MYVRMCAAKVLWFILTSNETSIPTRRIRPQSIKSHSTSELGFVENSRREWPTWLSIVATIGNNLTLLSDCD